MSLWYLGHSTPNPLGVVPDPNITYIVIGDKFSEAGVELLQDLKEGEKEVLMNDFTLYCDDVGVSPSECPEVELNNFLNLLRSTMCLPESKLYFVKAAIAKLNKLGLSSAKLRKA